MVSARIHGSVLAGVLLIYVKSLTGFGIMLGAAMGIFMFLNVWLIIWPNQKIVIASAKQVAGGGEALPGAAAALGKAGLANELLHYPIPEQRVFSGRSSVPFAVARELYQIAGR